MATDSGLIILDRDGVINEDSDDYIRSPGEWVPIPGALDAIATLHRAGFHIVVATNQSGVGRGYFDTATLEAIHRKMNMEIERSGGALSGIFYCPHAPEDACQCRKPRTGLLERIETETGWTVRGAPLVGDSLRDLQCAAAGKCRPVLVRTGKGRATLAGGLPDTLGDVAVHDSLADFATIMSRRGAGN